jgi:alkylhydroperoxidase/carboxymuconolactone decarboxylase family protein YurZ
MPHEHAPAGPSWHPSPPVTELLRRLSLNDERAVRDALSGAPTSAPKLDRRAEALVQLAVALACAAPAATCRVAVERARRARATDDELVSVLVSIAPALGAARLVAAVPALALAIDYDIEADEDES